MGLNLKRLYATVSQSSPALIWSATVLGLVVQFAVFGAIALEFYRSAVNSSFEVAEDVAALIEQDIARNIELYDLSLQSVVDKVNDPEIMALEPRLKQMAVFDRSTTAPGLGAMVVLDKNGTISLDSLQVRPRTGNFADREYFTFQRDTPHADGFYISKPFRARLQQGAWSISVSRRLTGSDGSFAGIVSGTLKLDFLMQRMEAVALGKHGVATLFRDDGTLVAQNVPNNPNVGANWSQAEVFQHLPGHYAGIFENDKSLDAVPRLYAFKRVAGFPLVVVAGVGRSDVLAPWWFKIDLIGAVFAAMAVSVLIVVAMFNRELRHRIAAEQDQAALARQDRLSQLANRLGFDEAFDAGWRRAARDRKPLSLILIDVDHFKEFNDGYGHVEGDRVLAALAEAIRSTVHRPGDVTARYGGEEFAVLLPDTGADGAVRVAEAIRERVRGLGIPHERNSHGFVTVSLGVATIVPGRTMVPDVLVRNADRALYAAKGAGRNHVCFDDVAYVEGGEILTA